MAKTLRQKVATAKTPGYLEWPGDFFERSNKVLEMMKVALGAALVWLMSSFLLAQADWREGNTLHGVNGYAWLEASETDKLATVAEILSGTYEQGLLNPEIMSDVNEIDDLRPYAEELVSQTDEFLYEKGNDDGPREALSDVEMRNEKVAFFVLLVMHQNGTLNLGPDACFTC